MEFTTMNSTSVLLILIKKKFQLFVKDFNQIDEKINQLDKLK